MREKGKTHDASEWERKSFKSDRKSYRDFKPFSTRCEFESFSVSVFIDSSVSVDQLPVFRWLIFAWFRGGDDRKWTTQISISLWVMVMRGGDLLSVSWVIWLLLTFWGAVNLDNFVSYLFLDHSYHVGHESLWAQPDSQLHNNLFVSWWICISWASTALAGCWGHSPADGRKMPRTLRIHLTIFVLLSHIFFFQFNLLLH